MQSVQIGNIEIGGGRLVLVAGPCVIESEAHARLMAESLKSVAAEAGVDFIFKASFDKANRSSISSYRGPGIEEGLRIMAAIKRDYDLPVTSDIHEAWQAEPAGNVLDVIQIPAFLCRQTDLLVAAARTGKPVTVKKGQFLAPWDMSNVVEKLKQAGNDQIILAERGASFGYNNLVCDLRSLGLMRALGCPVMLDVTHSLQLPGGQGSSSGGMREFIVPLARAGVAFGVDALFMEVHDKPAEALSDAANSFDLAELPALLKQLKTIHTAVNNG